MTQEPSPEKVAPAGGEAKAAGKSQNEAWRNIAVLLLIVAAFVLIYYLGRRHRSARLDAFAHCLAVKQVTMYGAFWCPHCADQKELFGSSFQYVPYVECGIKGSRAESDACVLAGVKRFPTWAFADGQRGEGVLQLQTLGQKTGCAVP